MSEPVKAWAIKAPGFLRIFVPCSIRGNEEAAVWAFVKEYGETWEEWENEGYRAVPVEIREVKE